MKKLQAPDYWQQHLLYRGIPVNPIKRLHFSCAIFPRQINIEQEFNVS